MEGTRDACSLDAEHSLKALSLKPTRRNSLIILSAESLVS
jgi:hypothetical protein